MITEIKFKRFGVADYEVKLMSNNEVIDKKRGTVKELFQWVHFGKYECNCEYPEEFQNLLSQNA